MDAWHSDDDGYYDVQQLDEIGGLAMRARFRTDENGRFWFWSIKPAAYPIPHDGPVGKMLEAQGRHPWRPAHVHFMISAPGHQTLVTHVFAAGDPYLDSDVVFGVKHSLIREFASMPAGKAADGRAMAQPYYHLNYDFGLKADSEARRLAPYAATDSAARSSTSAMASRNTLTPAPGLTPFSARWRRKARAPGTP
jgi:hydroxyquinol 1,2-dioxygenase